MSFLKILLILLALVLVVAGILVYGSLRSNSGSANKVTPPSTVIDTSNVANSTAPGQINIPNAVPATPGSGK